MTGNVFHYTAKGTIASYEKTNDGYETLVREVLSGLNDTIDYTNYDSDGDGYIDALCLSVPSRGNADFWYGCTASWWASTQCHLDKDCFIVRNSYTADKHFVYLLYFYLITLLT